MSLILPYDKKLRLSDGAYISPEGKIVYMTKGHERFAQEYCNGKYFGELNKIRSDAINGYHDELSVPDERWNCLKERLKYDGRREDVDIYLSSKLTKEQLELYKLWMEEFMFTKNNLYADFMIYVLGWDKVETVMRQGITTTSRAPHAKYFNYYLMGWNVFVKSPEIYSKETGCFVPDRSFNPYAVEEGAAVLELKELKEKVLKKDLVFFLK